MMKNAKDTISRREKIIYLELDRVIPCPSQPRRHFDNNELSGLAESIRENGVLQPITVRYINREYILVAGERRLRAAHIAGLKKIPCIVVDTDDKQTATLALLENIQRADLNFFEEAHAISHLMRICGYTQDTVAKKLGKSQSAVSNKLRLLSLGSDVISIISELNLTERHARALLRLSTREERISALEHISKNNLNVYQTDEYIDYLTSKRKPQKSNSDKKGRFVIKDVRLFYNTVGKALDTMRRAGFRTDFKKDEDESGIVMSIRIFK